MRGFLGQIPKKSGTLILPKRVGIIESNPFIFSASIHDNILMGRHYNEEKYQEALKFSALEGVLK